MAHPPKTVLNEGGKGNMADIVKKSTQPQIRHKPLDYGTDNPRDTSQPWGIWQKLLAYAALIAVSILAVCYVDLKVHMKASGEGTLQSISH